MALEFSEINLSHQLLRNLLIKLLEDVELFPILNHQLKPTFLMVKKRYFTLEVILLMGFHDELFILLDIRHNLIKFNL